jgi:hypothetical protein
VLISTITTAAVWLLVPLVRIERIEARARMALESSIQTGGGPVGA